MGLQRARRHGPQARGDVGISVFNPSLQSSLGQGLHGYLTGFLEQVNELGNRVSRDFLLPLAA